MVGANTHSSGAPLHRELELSALLQPRPLAEPLDPFRNRTAFARYLGLLECAEHAAERAFERMGDASFVENAELLGGQRDHLIADEANHARGMRRILEILEVPEPPDPSPAWAEFWERYVDGRMTPLPMDDVEAAVFALVPEAFAHATIAALAASVTDVEIAGILALNAEDEARHLAVSADLLARACGRARRPEVQVAAYLARFFATLRPAAREHNAIAQRAGIRPEELIERALALLAGLIGEILPGSRAAGALLAFATSGPLGREATSWLLARAIELPSPPLLDELTQWLVRVTRGSAELRDLER
jgi:hypothetical protein